jgi:hypothetical protein
MNVRLRDTAEVEKALGLPVLATMPDTGRDGHAVTATTRVG